MSLNLDKIRNVLPDFQIENFNMFDTINSLKWETSFDSDSFEECKKLNLEMFSTSGYEILIEFTGVSSLYFEGNGQIAGFYIKDMSSRGYENSSRYEIGDYEEGLIKFYCSDVIIKYLSLQEV